MPRPTSRRAGRRAKGTMIAAVALAVLLAAGAGAAQQAGSGQQAAMAPADRAKMLTSPGIFGVFSVHKLDPNYYRLSAAERRGASAEVAAVLAKHASRVIVDAYLTRGLESRSDFFLRVHAEDLAAAQAFLVDFRATRFGMYSDVTENLVGVTKPLNYITKQKSPTLNQALTATAYSGEPPRYAIMIPTKKSAEWWTLPPEQRLKEMETHTTPTLGFLGNVKRKLYHASGLDDADFITYFETNDLVAFNELVIALLSVPENKYNVRLGDPTVVGTIRNMEDVVKTLSATP